MKQSYIHSRWFNSEYTELIKIDIRCKVNSKIEYFFKIYFTKMQKQPLKLLLKPSRAKCFPNCSIYKTNCKTYPTQPNTPSTKASKKTSF